MTFIFKTILLTIILALVCSCASNKSDRVSFNSHRDEQNKSTSRYFDDMPSEPGKCYAKCILKDGSTTKWAEVVCNGDVNEKLYRNISNALYELGYLKESDIGTEWTKRKKTAFVQYQKDNNLPIGSLNLNTLISLKVQF